MSNISKVPIPEEGMFEFENSSWDEELCKICAEVEKDDRDMDSVSIEQALCDTCEAVETTVNVTIHAGRGRKSLPLLKKPILSPVPSTSSARIEISPSTSSARNGTGVAKPRLPNKKKKATAIANLKQRCKRRTWITEIDKLFTGISKPSRKRRKQSSTLERISKEGKRLYISTNADDAINATHLIKVEIYDLKKLSQVNASQRSKNATVKAKYFSRGPNSKNMKMAQKMILNMAEEISKS